MTDVGRVAIRANATRLLGRALEDPTLLGSLRERRFEPVDLHDGDLQAGYMLLCHLDRLGRLTHPHDESGAARSNAAMVNLRAISDWTIDRRRERERLRRVCLDQAEPICYHDDVPTSDELLLDSAARLNIVWWFYLWEQAWPPVPTIPRDVEVLERERTLRLFTALGIRLCQRGNARTAEPAEIADDVLERLDRIDPTAIGRYLNHRNTRPAGQRAEAVVPAPFQRRTLAP